MLSPLSGAGGPPLIQQNASEAEIFYNATGFLRCMGRQAHGRAMGMSQRRHEKPGLSDRAALEAGKGTWKD